MGFNNSACAEAIFKQLPPCGALRTRIVNNDDTARAIDIAH